MNKNISIPIGKVDNMQKIHGEAIYIGDMEFEGMIYAKTLRSDRSRAKIITIDIPNLPEGYMIVDKNDVPGKNIVKMVQDDQPFFAKDVVNYIGEPILLVVGPEKNEILKIIENIKVNYEDLQPILSIEDSEKGDIAPIYKDDNCFAKYTYYQGNAKEKLRDAKIIIEDEYTTGYQEHMYIEPQGMIGSYENGKVIVYGSLQCPYYVKNAVMQGLGWESDRVRIIQANTGGAFGGKEEYPSILAGHAAFAAVKSGRPVKIIFDRIEDMECTPKRHPSFIKYKTGLNENNQIVAMEAEVRLNGGAYSGLSNVVLQRTILAITGVYNITNLVVNGKVSATNTVPTGAFRGFGAPQAFFAIEMHMYNIATKLGIDPLEFKMRHMVVKGDSTSTGGTFRHDVKLPEMISEIDKMSGYSKKFINNVKNSTQIKKGIGISLFLHGCGFTGSGERDHIKATVKLKKLKDSKVEILVANVDMGQGLKTTLGKIVASVLNISIEDIVYRNPDTDRVPDSGPTVASRTIMIVGKLLEEAAKELKEKWHPSKEIEITKNYKHPEYIKWNEEKFEGDAYPTYSWGVNVVEVEIDPITLEIEIKGVWSIFDVGKAIDERIIMGQIEGGILQGLGYGMLEVLESTKGRIKQRTITDYIIPTSLDCVKMENKLIDNHYEKGPFGAKGAGELTLIGAAPALASAVANALGVYINGIPVTPEYLMEVMQNAKKY